MNSMGLNDSSGSGSKLWTTFTPSTVFISPLHPVSDFLHAGGRRKQKIIKIDIHVTDNNLILVFIVTLHTLYYLSNHFIVDDLNILIFIFFAHKDKVSLNGHELSFKIEVEIVDILSFFIKDIDQDAFLFVFG